MDTESYTSEGQPPRVCVKCKFPATYLESKEFVGDEGSFSSSATSDENNQQYLPTPVFQRWRQLAPNANWVNCWGQMETTAMGSCTPVAELGGMLSAPDPIGIEHLTMELRLSTRR